MMGVFLNAKHIHKCNAILNETVVKLLNILTKCFFPYLNSASYLKGTVMQIIL